MANNVKLRKASLQEINDLLALPRREAA